VVRSTKPEPRVCTVSSEETIDGVLTTEGVPRDSDVRTVMKGLSSVAAAHADE
jgi:hypothetical protein